MHPSPRVLVVRAGPSLFPWTPGTLLKAGPGSHSSQALTCLHTSTGPWLALLLPSWPLAPTLTLAGRARDPSWFSQHLPTAEPHSREAQQAWMEPIRVCLSRQTLVGKCDSWPHRRQVAAGSQDHIALTDLHPIPLLYRDSGLMMWALPR